MTGFPRHSAAAALSNDLITSPKPPVPTPIQPHSPWMSFVPPGLAPLEEDATVDVCVVGAGIAGLTTAYLLTKKGKKVMVIDDGPIGGGMTSRSTAHLMTAIDDRYCEVERLHGVDGARMAARSHAAAIDAIEAIIEHEKIDCDFARVDGFLFLPPRGDPQLLRDEIDAAHRAGVEGLAWADCAPIDGFDTGRCLKFPRQGQLHPLKYLAGLARAIAARGGRIHCGVHAQQIEGGDHPWVRTASGLRIDCQELVVATNTPITDIVSIHDKQAPYLTYVIAARVPRGTVAPALFWDTLENYHYVCLDKAGGEILIVGGEDHKAGQADDSEQRFANLELWTRERFPAAREVLYRWSGQLMQTVDFLAFAGRNPGEEHVYVATGDSGMGMTHGTIAAIIITELIHGVAIPWAGLYSPSRFRVRAAKEYARDLANAARQSTDWMGAGEAQSMDPVREGAGAVIRRGASKIAVYRDASGELHEMSAVCPHLGCLVKWNSAESTWNCKCHGSRFDAMGRVIGGPAVSDLAPAEKSITPHVATRHTGQRPPTARH